MWYWGHGFWMLVWWLVIAAAVVSVLWVMARLGSRRQDSAETAEELLRRRFATGEIEEEEYDRRLAALRQRRR